MTFEAIDNLKQDIEQTNKELLAKKFMLKSLEKEQQKAVAFSQTRLGGIYFKTLRAVVSPFAAVSKACTAQLEHPYVVQAMKLEKRADKLLNKAEIIEGREESEAPRMAVRCAEMVMCIEKFTAQHEIFAKSGLEALRCQLHQQVGRLRPAVDQSKFEDARSMIDNIIDSIKPKQGESNA